MDQATRSKLGSQATGLAIGHAVSGILIGTLGLMFLGHVAVGIAVLVGALPLDPSSGPAMNALFGGMFLVIGAFALVLCEAWAVMLLYAASCFLRTRHRTFLLVVQGLNLLHQPIGTVLGVLGLVWLFQPDVKELFDEAEGR